MGILPMRHGPPGRATSSLRFRPRFEIGDDRMALFDLPLDKLRRYRAPDH